MRLSAWSWGLPLPHDPDTLARLAAACDDCDQMLSFRRVRQDEEMLRDGVP